MAKSSGEGIGEVAADGTSIVIASVVSVIYLACGSVAEVVARLILVAGIDFESVCVWVEVAAVL